MKIRNNFRPYLLGKRKRVLNKNVTAVSAIIGIIMMIAITSSIGVAMYSLVNETTKADSSYFWDLLENGSSDSETDPDIDTDPDTGINPEYDLGPDPEANPDPDPETDPEPDPETDPNPDPDPVPEPPNKPNMPSGPQYGEVGNAYTYATNAIDPNGDQIYYRFSWDEGSTNDWQGPYDSGDIISDTHSWGQGSYHIKVQAKDTQGNEGQWSDILTVSIVNPQSNPSTSAQQTTASTSSTQTTSATQQATRTTSTQSSSQPYI